MNSNQKMQLPTFNPLSIFSCIDRTRRSESNLLYGKYPCGDSIGCFIEVNNRPIEDFSKEEKFGLKTIVAHMCKVGKEIREVYGSISLCEKGIKYAKEEVKDETLSNLYVSLSERELEVNTTQKIELLGKIQILVALLIKDSYYMTRECRNLILDFLTKAKIVMILDEGIATNTNKGFKSVYLDSAPYTSSGLSGIYFENMFDSINIFALNSSDLKPKDLPSELEEEWPLNEV
ncbi:MAG: hypothetical protein C5B43_01560 [Verrucomicrobia bacterium]|nr:MAG: hypothetical protein C5B43_01560 [Verrucomicrobiota bacterium]